MGASNASNIDRRDDTTGMGADESAGDARFVQDEIALLDLDRPAGCIAEVQD
jgi:hypothetical protein